MSFVAVLVYSNPVIPRPLSLGVLAMQNESTTLQTAVSVDSEFDFVVHEDSVIGASRGAGW